MKPIRILTIACFATLLSACATVRQVQDPATLSPDGKATVDRPEKALAYNVAINIKAEPKVVWAILTNGPEYTSWNSTIIKLEGAIAPGEKIKVVSKSAPDRTFKLKVTEFTPEKRMVWEDGMPMGMFSGVRTYTLTPAADGSTHFGMSEVLSGGMLKSIAKSVPDQRPFFETFAADLKRKAEAATPQP